MWSYECCILAGQFTACMAFVCLITAGICVSELKLRQTLKAFLPQAVEAGEGKVEVRGVGAGLAEGAAWLLGPLEGMPMTTANTL